MSQKYYRNLIGPINHGTVLQCHVCSGHAFEVMWFSNPIWKDGEVLSSRWGVKCLGCDVISLMDPDGVDPQTSWSSN